MSSVYATEPSTSGRVLFDTTHGPLEIQLWCRECPTTTKLFLQLCMDGFYDDMLFHRIVPDFLIQVGALRYGNKPVGFSKEYQTKVEAPHAMERRKYETHSRLRFNHRGQIAMALGVSEDDDEELQPQFFLTLDEAPYLDTKHVLFGTCTGSTIFNALRIGKLAVNDDHQPLDLEHAPRIKSVKIVENPIHVSLSPLASVPWHSQNQQESTAQKKKKKRKGKKDFNVLSFGDEMEDGADTGTGFKSSHDLVSSKALSKAVDEKVKEVASTANGEGLVKPRNETKRREEQTEATNREILEMSAKDSLSEAAILLPPPVAIQEISEINNEISQRTEKQSKEPKISVLEARLARFKGKKMSKREREEDTMAKLIQFKSKVQKQTAEIKSERNSGHIDDSLAARMARKAASYGQKTNDNADDDVPTYSGQVLEDDGDEPQSKWMGTRFKCKQHIDHSSRLGDNDEFALGGDGRTVEDYEVIDGKKADEGTDERQHRLRKHNHKHHGSRRHQYGGHR